MNYNEYFKAVMCSAVFDDWKVFDYNDKKIYVNKHNISITLQVIDSGWLVTKKILGLEMSVYPSEVIFLYNNSPINAWRAFKPIKKNYYIFDIPYDPLIFQFNLILNQGEGKEFMDTIKL